MHETLGWYSDYTYLPTSNQPWVRRGGSYNNTGAAGQFSYGNSYGNAAGDITTRFVLHY